MFRPRCWRIPACLALAAALPAPAQSTADSSRAADTLQTEETGGLPVTPPAADDPPLPLSGELPDTIPSAIQPDTVDVVAADSAVVVPDSAVVPDSTWRWPDDRRAIPCREPLESVSGCWRADPLWAPVETGFPGLRAWTTDLSSLEPLRVRPHFQPALSESPYGTGGHLPFHAFERGSAADESWAPVQPLDTPITRIHWMRGALEMNQFRLDLRRMVGNRAYLGLEYHSNGATSRFYDYLFNVHQPYLGAGRDSLSLVIQDTSHLISTRHMRPRLGFWLDANTVVELHADWLDNGSSLANPTNPAANDSAQLLYPASFGAFALGGQVARATEARLLRASFRHATWERSLRPVGDARYAEDAAGTLDALQLEATARNLPGSPRATLEVENAFHENALWTRGDVRATPDARARGDRETLRLDAAPAIDPLALDLRGEASRRARADGAVEWLGGARATAALRLPLGFGLSGGAGWLREGAPDDALFRWQPALGLYPNPDLKPRTHVRFGAGAEWESKYLGFGAELERHRFDDNWLPRVLPQPGACDALADPDRYPSETASCAANGDMPDSLALALVNYDEETRDLLHLSVRLALGNWRLSLRNTSLLANAVRDPRPGFTGLNWRVPESVFGGRLLWRRRVLDDRLGLQTQWDWEWFSDRYVFASDMDGSSRGIYLDEYLALDFTARMEIKTFMLFFRAMNLFHDRYATEPGVHPPGVNFRFGVDWTLRN